MAVRDGSRGWPTLLLCGWAACLLPGVASAERAADAMAWPAAAVPMVAIAEQRLPTPIAQHWRELWRHVGERMRDARPEWLHHFTGHGSFETTVRPGVGNLALVVQEDRPDGTELLTARYTLHDGDGLRAYAGAGLNYAQYFHNADGDPAPTMLTRRNRRSSMGAAAEFGAELRVSEHMQVNAAVRWADLDDDAEVLRAEHGPVVADDVMLGLSVGYRFR
jgi:hypothetical protein